MFCILFFLSTLRAAEPKVVVSARVDIVDVTGVEWLHLAESSKSSLQTYTNEWWDTLPVLRQIETFPQASDAELQREADRMLNWYIDQGWRDATVSYGWVPYKSQPFLRAPKGREPVQAKFSIFLGGDWTLTNVSIKGLSHDEESVSMPSIPIMPRSWNRSVQQGINKEIRRELGKRGFANPSIHWQSTSTDEREVELEAFVEWGERYTFGTVEIVDDEAEPWDILRTSLTGKEYDETLVEKLEHRVLQLPSVADAEVSTILNEDNYTVSVVVQATRNTKRQLKGVGGLTTQATTWAFDGGLQWTVLNHRAPSLSLKGRHTLGYRAFPNQGDFSHRGWGTHHQLEGAWAAFPTQGIQILTRGYGWSDLQMGYQEQVLMGEFGLRWLPNQRWTVDLTQGWTTHQFSNVAGQSEIFERWFGQTGLGLGVETVDVSLLSTWDIPNISFVQLELTPVGMMNGSSYQRFHFQGEVHRQRDRWLWRNRAEFGVLRWMAEPVSTLHGRFFLGGGHSLRGWSYNKVHPPGYDGQFFDVNVGGDKVLFLSSEVQYTLVSGYRLLTFVDVGRVWERWDDPMPWTDLQPSTGLGFVMPTMVGDVAFIEAVGLYRDTDLLNPPNRFVFHCILVRELGAQSL